MFQKFKQRQENWESCQKHSGKRNHWQHINTICAQMLNFPFYLSQHFFAQALLLVTKVDQVWVLGLVSDGFQALNNGGQKQKCIINCFIINAVT